MLLKQSKNQNQGTKKEVLESKNMIEELKQNMDHNEGNLKEGTKESQEDLSQSMNQRNLSEIELK